MAVTTIALIAKEAKTLRFTVKDSDGNAVDCSSATALQFIVKEDDAESRYIINKTTSDFDVTDAASGIIDVSLSSSDLDLAQAVYECELIITFSSTNIDKTKMKLDIERSIEN